MTEDSFETVTAKLRQAEASLERSERIAVASRYASVIMHEVNNPLEAISNLVYLTKLQKNEPDQVVENMTIIENQLETLGRVTKQALTFHREQHRPVHSDLTEIAESALKLHRDKLARHGIVVERRYRAPAVAIVLGSEILQVVSNLILNAVDVLEHGNGRICVSVKRCPSSMQMTVSDNGPGIPKQFAAKLFEPYVTSKVSGTGLGLWLSSRIIGKHGGTLRFRTCTESGRSGTTFRISLPHPTPA